MSRPDFPYVNKGSFIVTPNPPTLKFGHGDFWVYEGGMTETDERGYAIGLPTLNLRVPSAYIVEWHKIPAQVQRELIAAARKNARCDEATARNMLAQNPVAFQKSDVIMMRSLEDKPS